MKALTGIETDTHPQERARGLTIDVGFAYWKEGVTLLDVPGHERFVKNAVAGVSSVDLALFVVAADDGVMPQTREHLAILRLLGVSDGIVALTKTDLVEPEWVEMVVEDLRELLAGTFLEAAEIVPVSSVTGEGIGRLRELLEERIAGVGETPRPRRPAPARGPRLLHERLRHGGDRHRPGRVGAAQGTSWSCSPGAVRCACAGVQIHGRDVAQAGPGGPRRREPVGRDRGRRRPRRHPGRGRVLRGHEPDRRPTCRSSTTRPRPVLKHRDRLRLHLGPGEVLARVVLLDADALAPGDSGFVQLRPGEAGDGRPRGPLRRRGATRPRGPWPGASSSIPGPAGTGGGARRCWNGCVACTRRTRGRSWRRLLLDAGGRQPLGG